MGTHNVVHSGAISPFVTGPEIRIGSHFAKSLKSDKGDELLAYLRKRAFSDIYTMSIDPLDYVCPDEFRRDYQAVSMFSKYPHPVAGVLTPREKCLEKFWKNEARCQSFNESLSKPVLSGEIPADAILFLASRKIASVLDDIDWPKVFTYVRPTSGASTRCTKKKGDVYYKVQGKPDVTPNCWLRAVQLVCSHPLWYRAMIKANGSDPKGWFHVVPGNTVDTVPKKGDEERTIGVEPEMNMLLQRAYGLYLRQRLLRCGIDLRTQVRNQRAARRGARWGIYATVDFSSASDLNVYCLPLQLLPTRHFEILDVTRSPRGSLRDPDLVGPPKWFEWEKIASMGNGWCFELETLMFWAIAEATCEYHGGRRRRCLVYGDDVIIPAKHAQQYIDVMGLTGHKPNESKTFIAGPFRESCGKHYFETVDVTPIYVRRPAITTGKTDKGEETFESIELYKLGNSIRRWAAMPTPGFADPRYIDTWNLCVSLVNDPCVVPWDHGDGGFAMTFSEALPLTALRRKKRGYQHLEFRYDTEVITSRVSAADDFGYLRYWLYNGMTDERTSDVAYVVPHKAVRAASYNYRRPTICKVPPHVSEWTCGLSSPCARLKRRHTSVEQWSDAPYWCV